MPISVTNKTNWRPRSTATFACGDLLSINKLFSDLQNEELLKQEIDLYQAKLDFYEIALTSDEPIEQLNKKKEEFKLRNEELEAKKHQLKHEAQRQENMIRQRFDESAHNETNDHNSETSTSIPIRLCRCSSPLNQARIFQFSSDTSNSRGDDDDKDEAVFSKPSIHEWLNTHPDVYSSFGESRNIRKVLFRSL